MVLVPVLASLLLGGVLLVAAAAKVLDPAGTRAALATYGPAGPRLWAPLVVLEAVLGALVLAGAWWASALASLLFAAVAAVHLALLVRGRAGAPCACFGARGRIGFGSVARAVSLAAAFGALAALPRDPLSAEGWLALGLGLALLAVGALAVVVLALAREVGELKALVGPQAALEVPEEGPELGGTTAIATAFSGEPDRFALAVFASEGCHLCRALRPDVEAVGRHPVVELLVFDEVEDAWAWRAADVPGSPFAVVLGADGVVLAKGTFNSRAQLESVLGAAERRQAAAHA